MGPGGVKYISSAKKMTRGGEEIWALNGYIISVLCSQPCWGHSYKPFYWGKNIGRSYPWTNCLGTCCWRGLWDPGLFLSFSLPDTNWKSFCYHILPLWCVVSQNSMGSTHHGLKPLKLWGKTNLSSFKFNYLRLIISVIVTEGWISEWGIVCLPWSPGKGEDRQYHCKRMKK
jgi:hypothetical protein